MKTLHLLRHAKSSWRQPALSDRDRPLNKRGKRDAPRIGRALAQRLSPMPMHVSPARRAQLTLQGLCAGWPQLNHCVHLTQESLYTFSSDVIYQWIQLQPDRAVSLFVISHNPALTDLVNELAGRHWLENLPTAGYVELLLPIERWRDLPECTAVVEYSLFPKQLR